MVKNKTAVIQAAFELGCVRLSGPVKFDGGVPKPFARPPLKCLATEIDFDTGRREIVTFHQKLAKRLLSAYDARRHRRALLFARVRVDAAVRPRKYSGIS